jgi:hypothetical protein
MALIDALWVGPVGYVTTNKVDLIPGVTIVQISEGEAEASDNWQPLTAKAPTSTAPTPPPLGTPGDANTDDEGKN